MLSRIVLGVCVGVAYLASATSPRPAAAQEKKPAAAADKAPSWKAEVAPLLKDACASCHSGRKQKARLDVTSYDSVLRTVKPGNPDGSKLHRAITGKGAKMMPPKNPLAQDQIALLRAWIAAGAKKN
jgi:mono/diheme cytochrome c family protein